MTTDNVRVLKTGTCPSLSGKSRLTYEIGSGPASEICVRITKNTGGGMFGKGWVALDQVHRLVNDKPITSTTLAPLFKGGSANSAGFLLAVMKHEGLVQPSGRAYQRLGGKAFFAEIKTLMGSPGKAGQPHARRSRRRKTADTGVELQAFIAKRMDNREMQRRVFAASAVLVPHQLFAQTPKKLVRIGWINNAPFAGSEQELLFVQAMRERGWVQGRHFVIEARHSDNRNERLPALAAELVQSNVDLIICAGKPAALAAQKSTKSIPILFWFIGDPVGTGLVESFSRPGGNVTGLGGFGAGTHLKQLEFLQEVVPREQRIALFVNPLLNYHTNVRAELDAGARARGVVLRPVEVRSPDDIEAAFEAVARDEIRALLIVGQPLYFPNASRVASLATQHRLPAIVSFVELARAGLLMSYGSKWTDDLKRLPHFVERIVSGVRPAEMPVEQPIRFYLTINAKTAKAMGVAIPRTLILRADEVIE